MEAYLRYRKSITVQLSPNMEGARKRTMYIRAGAQFGGWDVFNESNEYIGNGMDLDGAMFVAEQCARCDAMRGS